MREASLEFLKALVDTPSPSGAEGPVARLYRDYATAYAAWKAEAQRTVDNAHTRYFIAHLHRLRDEEAATSDTEELG